MSDLQNEFEEIGVIRECRFTMVDNQIFEDGNLSGYAKLVYMALCYFADNHTGLCYPSLKALAEKSKISVRSVQRALIDLETGGYIERTQRNMEEVIRLRRKVNGR
jgi:Uncharacterized membrane-associated protein/domain